MFQMTFNKRTIPKLFTAFYAMLNSLLEDKEYIITVKQKRNKRSNDANSYCWVLCEKLAVELSRDGEIFTKEDIYRNAIREVGIYRDYPNLSVDNAKTLTVAWGKQGIGWITEQVDFMPDRENVLLRCYYGSSTYNTKQMSRLIEYIISDCKELGIETKTPDEIADMLSLWESAREEWKTA